MIPVRFAALLALVATLAVAVPGARAQPEDTPPAPAAPAPAGGALPVSKGDPAPMDGVLLSEERITYYLNLDLKLKEAELKVEARDRALKTLEGDLAAAKSRTWWDKHQFWAGAATTLVVIIAGAQAIDKFK